MNEPSRTTSLTLRADEIARRFERVCRRRVADCRVEARLGTDGTDLELRVAPIGKGPAESLSVSGLDGDSWADGRGMEGLVRVVSVWVDPPAEQPERQAMQPSHHSLERRASGPLQGTGAARVLSAAGTPSP